MTLNAAELVQVRSQIDLWWGSYYKIVKSRRGEYLSMPNLLDGEIFYSTDTNEHFGGDDDDGPHLVSGLLQGLRADRPSPGVEDRLYYATDECITYVDNGSVWKVFGTVSKRKSADESVSLSTVLQNDDELYFSLNANEKSTFEFVVFFTTATSTPDIKVGIGADSGVDSIRYSIQFMQNNPTTVIDGSIQTTDSGSDSYGYGGACDTVIYIRGSVDNANAFNTIYLTWSQLVSNATPTIVKEGSYVTWRLVS